MVPTPSEASIFAAYGISRSQSRQARKTGEKEAVSVFRLQLCKSNSKAQRNEGKSGVQHERRRPCSAPVGIMSADEIRWLVGAPRPRLAEQSVGQIYSPPSTETNIQGFAPQHTAHAFPQDDEYESRKRSQSPGILEIATSFSRETTVPGGNRPHTAGECPLRIRRAASLSRIMEHQEIQQKAQSLRRVDTSLALRIGCDRSKSRHRAGFTRQQSRGVSSPFPKRPPAFNGVSSMKNTTPVIPSSPSQTLVELKRRRAKDKEMLQSRTDADLHDDQVYFTDYAMRIRARKMWHRELKAAKEADHIVDATQALTPSSDSTEGVPSSKARQIILMEGTEKNGVADAVERLLGRMRGLGEASECVKGLAVTAGLVPKPKKLPRLSGKGSNNQEVEKDLFTLQVRELKGQLKDSLFDVIREQEVQADVAKTMADAFQNVAEKAAHDQF